MHSGVSLKMVLSINHGCKILRFYILVHGIFWTESVNCSVR
jgi:hypothetical protein